MTKNKQENIKFKYPLLGLAFLALGTYYLAVKWHIIFAFQHESFIFYPNWLLLVILIIIFTVLLLATGVFFITQKKIPKWLLYSYVVTLTAHIITDSFQSFHFYQSRLCNNESLHSCPQVVGELMGTFLFDLVIYSLGIWVIYLIYNKSKNKTIAKK